MDSENPGRGSAAFALTDAALPAPDLSAFASFYVDHAGFVWSCVRRLGVQEELVEDAVQDTFITAFRRLDSYLGQATERAWLYGIARRVASRYRRTFQRRARKHLAYGQFYGSSHGEHVMDIGERVSSRALIERGLSCLDDDKRAVFLLSEVHGMSAREVSDALEVPVTTVESRLKAARRRFRAYLVESGVVDDRASLGPELRELMDKAREHERPAPQLVTRGWLLLLPQLTVPMFASGSTAAAGASASVGISLEAKGLIGAALLGCSMLGSAIEGPDVSRSRTSAFDTMSDGGLTGLLSRLSNEEQRLSNQHAAAESMPRLGRHGGTTQDAHGRAAARGERASGADLLRGSSNRTTTQARVGASSGATESAIVDGIALGSSSGEGSHELWAAARSFDARTSSMSAMQSEERNRGTAFALDIVSGTGLVGRGSQAIGDFGGNSGSVPAVGTGSQSGSTGKNGWTGGKPGRDPADDSGLGLPPIAPPITYPADPPAAKPPTISPPGVEDPRPQCDAPAQRPVPVCSGLQTPDARLLPPDSSDFKPEFAIVDGADLVLHGAVRGQIRRIETPLGDLMPESARVDKVSLKADARYLALAYKWTVEGDRPVSGVSVGLFARNGQLLSGQQLVGKSLSALFLGEQGGVVAVLDTGSSAASFTTASWGENRPFGAQVLSLFLSPQAKPSTIAGFRAIAGPLHSGKVPGFGIGRDPFIPDRGRAGLPGLDQVRVLPRFGWAEQGGVFHAMGSLTGGVTWAWRTDPAVLAVSQQAGTAVLHGLISSSEEYTRQMRSRSVADWQGIDLGRLRLMGVHRHGWALLGFPGLVVAGQPEEVPMSLWRLSTMTDSLRPERLEIGRIALSHDIKVPGISITPIAPPPPPPRSESDKEYTNYHQAGPFPGEQLPPRLKPTRRSLVPLLDDSGCFAPGIDAEGAIVVPYQALDGLRFMRLAVDSEAWEQVGDTLGAVASAASEAHAGLTMLRADHRARGTGGRECQLEDYWSHTESEANVKGLQVLDVWGELVFDHPRSSFATIPAEGGECLALLDTDRGVLDIVDLAPQTAEAVVEEDDGPAYCTVEMGAGAEPGPTYAVELVEPRAIAWFDRARTH